MDICRYLILILILLRPGGPVEQGTYNGAYDFLVQNWQDTYDGIQRANTVIKNVSGMAIDETVKNRILGEARF